LRAALSVRIWLAAFLQLLIAQLRRHVVLLGQR
jgi:hypothetical protein